MSKVLDLVKFNSNYLIEQLGRDKAEILLKKYFDGCATRSEKEELFYNIEEGAVITDLHDDGEIDFEENLYLWNTSLSGTDSYFKSEEEAIDNALQVLIKAP